MCVQEQDILACVKERDVLAGVQERDILTGTPPDWRYCQINSIIIDYREQSVLIEWIVWVCMFKRGLVRRYKCHIIWRVCKSGISWWVCKSTGYPGVCARADILASVQGPGYPDGCARTGYPVVCARAGYPGVCEGAGCPGGCAGAGYPDGNPARLAVLSD